MPEGPTTQLRALIADPAELVRRGIGDVLARDARYAVVGEASDAEHLMEECARRRPDLLFFGIEGPEERRLAALQQVKVLRPGLRAIVLIESRRLDDVWAAIRAGANALLLRDAPAATLLQALDDVLSGGSALDPRLTHELFEQLASGLPGPTWDIIPNPSTLAALSSREREVLQLLTHGRRNKEIAGQLGVSVGTVKTHLRHIFRKLNVADRTGAVLAALRGQLPKAA